MHSTAYLPYYVPPDVARLVLHISRPGIPAPSQAGGGTMNLAVKFALSSGTVVGARMPSTI